MKLFYISIFVGILTFLCCNIVEYLILGDRGRDKQISNHFKYIRGEAITEKKNKHKKKMGNKKKIQLQLIGNNQTTKISKKVYIIYAMPVCISIFVIIYVASKSIGFAFVISLIGLIYPKTIIINRVKKRERIISIQLRDALNSIVSSLKAGLSINSALIKCSEDLEKIYLLVKEKPMLDELNKIKSDLNMGMSVDDALRNFMKRMKMEDVDDFVNTVVIVRQKGGNLVDVMTNVTQMITDKGAMKREMEILTASKKMEAKIMTIVPIIIIVLLSIFSADYMRPLYESVIGKIFIIIGFIFLVINYFIAKKIVDIQI